MKQYSIDQSYNKLGKVLTTIKFNDGKKSKFLYLNDKIELVKEAS